MAFMRTQERGVDMSTMTDLHALETVEQTKQEEMSQKPAKPILLPSFFADVLLESDRTEKRRKRWAAASSVVFQSIFLAIMLIVPLMFTEGLPKAQLLTFLIAPPPPPPPPAASAAPAVQMVKHIASDISDGRLRMPSRIPEKVQMIREEEAPPQLSSVGGVVGGVLGGIPGGQLGGVIGGIVSAASNMAAVPKLAAPTISKRIRVSQGVTKGMLLSKVEPRYPTIALGARVQGVVVLTAIISKAGNIQNLTVVTGHPMLVPAAMDAVRQWRYRPFMLSGEPVEVETTVTVTFQLSS